MPRFVVLASLYVSNRVRGYRLTKGAGGSTHKGHQNNCVAIREEQTSMLFNRLLIVVGAWLCASTVGVAVAQAPAAIANPDPALLTKAQVQRVLLLDAVRAGARTVAVGDRGYVVVSDNNGESWRRVKAPTNVLLTAVFFVGDKTGWMVGHDSVILATTDGGDSWTKQFSAPDEQKPLLDVMVMPDGKKGFAVGAYGAFYATEDAGKTWTARKISQDDKHLNAIIALNDSRLLIVGEAGTILFSSDAGMTWTPAMSPYNGSYFGALEAADKSLVIFGMRGRVFRSTDAGLTWTQNEIKRGDKPFQSSLMGGKRLLDGSIVLAGVQGAAVFSNDNGATYKLLETRSNRPFSGVVQATPNTVILIGEAGPTDFQLK
jgi:photosystem II stability/assembly factor-like uncharacterized protein